MEPFGRPLLTFLASYIIPDQPTAVRPLTQMMWVGLQVWLLLLARNRGLTYKFVMGALPCAPMRVYVDAALTGGVGGFFGRYYFSHSIVQLKPYLIHCDGWDSFPEVNIAWFELLAACIAIYIVAPRFAGTIINLYSDNTNTVAWLTNRRPDNPYICALIAAIERVKYDTAIKISTHYISTKDNSLADRLSRGDIPARFMTHGYRLKPPMEDICKNLQIRNIVDLWNVTIN